MNTQHKRISWENGIALNQIQDSKFKHSLISIYFMLPLQKDSASSRAIVPFLWRNSSATYPNLSELNWKLNDLYGADLTASVGRSNGWQTICLSIRTLDNRFALNQEDLSLLSAQLLLDLILNPHLDENNLFFEDEFLLERQYLIDTIESEINDKRTYSQMRCQEVMNPNSPISINPYGTVEQAEKTTNQDVVSAWKTLLEQAHIEVFLTSAQSCQKVQEYMQQKLTSLQRNPIPLKLVPCQQTANPLQEVKEHLEVQQSNLVMGFRVGDLSSLEHQDAARVFSALYGGTPSSKLFMKVREEMSLCYFCSASIQLNNNIMLVSSGIEAKNKNAAQQAILEQLTAMQQGDFSEDEWNKAKGVLCHSMTATQDSLSYLPHWYFSQIWSDTPRSPQQAVQAIQAVTREQVIEIAHRVELDTIYFLTGKENS